MNTLRENLYVNTFLEKEERGIWCRWFYNRYEVAINRNGKYVLKFENNKKAIEFLERINQDANLSMQDNIITINRNDHLPITINCGKNEQLAIKLTKHLRQQWVKQRKLQLKERKQNTKQQIEDTGLKI